MSIKLRRNTVKQFFLTHLRSRPHLFLCMQLNKNKVPTPTQLVAHVLWLPFIDSQSNQHTHTRTQTYSFDSHIKNTENRKIQAHNARSGFGIRFVRESLPMKWRMKMKWQWKSKHFAT